MAKPLGVARSAGGGGENDLKLRVALLGFGVGDEYFKKYCSDDPFPQVAAYKLESRFAAAMECGGGEVVRISSAAVSTYPHNKTIYFPALRFHDNNWCVIPLLNLPGLKMFSRLVGSTLGVFRVGRKGVDALCVYSAHSPNLIAAYIGSKVLGVPFFVYMPDLPLLMGLGKKRSSFGALLKRLDSWVIDCIVSASSGIFAITDHMVKDSPAWCNKPYTVIEGIAGDAQEYAAPPGERLNVVFYAGGVNESYGIRHLVEGFLKSGLQHELWICGRGDLEGYLKDVAEENPRVKYLGFLAPSEVSKIQERSALLVMARDPQEKYTRYSFPSKLLEYMASGVPVLTTRLDGVPEEYYEFLNIIDYFSIDGICEALEKFSQADQEDLLRKAVHAKEWVQSSKSCFAFGGKIIDFMRANS